MEALINWKFNKDDCKPDLIEIGDHRVRIEEAEATTSKSGSPMIKLTLAVSGTNSKAWYYLTFPSQDNPRFEELRRYTNRNLDNIRDSFDIPDKDILTSINPSAWVGKVGAARFKQEINQNDGTINSRISFFIRRDKQSDLPAWKEPANSKVDAASLRTEIPQEDLDALFPFGDNA